MKKFILKTICFLNTGILCATPQSISHLEAWLGESDENALLIQALEEHKKELAPLPQELKEEELLRFLNRILAAEKISEDRYVFYHGALPSVAFGFDLFSAFFRLKNGLNAQNAPLIMRQEQPIFNEMDAPNIQSLYFNKIYPRFIEEQKSYLLNSSPDKIQEANKKLFERFPKLILKPDEIEDFKNNRPFIRGNGVILQFIPLSDDPSKKNDKDSIYSTHFLCANNFLFGSFKILAGYSLAFLLNQEELMTQNRLKYMQQQATPKAVIERFLNDLSIPLEHREKYFSLYQKYFGDDHLNNGRLYQIFMDRESVDQLVYLCEPNGLMVAIPDKEKNRLLSTAEILAAIKENPSAFDQRLRNLDRFEHRVFHYAAETGDPSYPHYQPTSAFPLFNLLQSRIWMHPRHFTKAQLENKIIVKHYFLKEIDLENYQKELDALVQSELY